MSGGSGSGKAAVFLDRDGVINLNRDSYVRTVDEMVFIPEALRALARLRDLGITVVTVSNQAGVGQGLIDRDELRRMDRRLIEVVSSHGGEIAATYYCPHRSDDGCDCRKPGIGMLLRASSDLGLDLRRSYLVGDAQSDIAAGVAAGCTTVLVLTGRSTAEDVLMWKVKPAHVALHLEMAVDWIVGSPPMRGTLDEAARA